MHTYNADSVTIQHNGDYKGDCTIIDSNGVEITVNCEDIMGFAAQAIRNSIISKIEDMPNEEILMMRGR